MGKAHEIADELERLCCAESEGQFFDYVTESVGTICRLLRENDPRPINAQIAEQLGWTIWEDMRPGNEGRWFMENAKEVRLVPDYISILRDDVMMHTAALKTS